MTLFRLYLWSVISMGTATAACANSGFSCPAGPSSADGRLVSAAVPGPAAPNDVPEPVDDPQMAPLALCIDVCDFGADRSRLVGLAARAQATHRGGHFCVDECCGQWR